MAATIVFRIEPFRAEGNNATNRWNKWKIEFANFLEANNLNVGEIPDKRKLAIFLMVCGDDLKTIYESFAYRPQQSPTIKQVFEKFDSYFIENAGEIFASFEFWNPKLKQHEGETFDEFYRKVKEASVDCNFGDGLSRNIRDKIIIGISNNALRERLLREKKMDEKQVVLQCRISEKSHMQSLCMATSALNIKEEPQIDVLKTNNSRAKQKVFSCNNCGTSHAVRKCPAFGQKCYSCGKMHHWKKVCKSSCQRTVNELVNSRNETEDSSEHLYISEIVNAIETSASDWHANAIFNNKYTVHCKLDTGAQANVISYQRLKKMKYSKAKISPTNKTLRAFGGSKIVLGICYIDVELNNKLQNLCFFISKIDTKTILRYSACKQFNLVKDINQLQVRTPESIIKEFADVFEGQGCLKTVSIILAKNAQPHIAAPRMIPLALYKSVKQELERMCAEKIIAKIKEPTDWVSNMHVITKKDKIRIVLDPRPLNKYIKRPHFYIPTQDELMSKLSGCKIFTVLDAKSAFWQQPLDENSSYLTTFTTPFGRYRFLKVSYGLVNAPEAFQSAMIEIFKDIPEILPYFDDIVIGSKSMEEHLILLRKVLETARNHNLKFSKEKIQLASSEITYIGKKFSFEGISPFDNKVQAIINYCILI